MSNDRPRSPAQQSDYERQLRQMNEALLKSSVREQELREKAEQAEVAMARLAAIVTSSEDAIISKDTDGFITSWNRGAEHLFGYAAEDAVGRSVTILIPEDHLDEEPEILARIRRGESIEHYETVRRRKDGALLDISLTVSPIRDASGAVIGASKIARDITERKQIEQALRESEERYRMLFDSMDEGYCIIEVLFDANQQPVDYRFVEVNSAFQKQAGMDDVVGKRMLEFVPSIEEHWLANYGQVALTGEPVRFYGEYKGLHRWFEVYAFRVGEMGENKVAVLFQDITARKQAERRIQEQAGELADAGRRKDEFLAMLSHELRGPMAPMFNALQLMGRDGSENQLQREARGVIERQARHLSRLTDDLLEVSRITTGRIGLHLERVDLNGIVKAAVERIQPNIDRRQQQLTVALAEGVVWLEADSARLEQVFGNLLNNASKYGKPGGRIWLSFELASGRIQPEASGGRQPPEEAIVRVRDNGIGIAAELLPDIFDLFTQADKSLDRSEGGLGIGLALVKSLVELHRGTVEARSDGIGRGSEFIVRLPLASDEGRGTRGDHQDSSLTTDHSPLTTALRILVVDDSVDAAKMCGMLLRAWGHEVRTAHNGPDALGRAAGFHPHVILCDIGLPDMDGYEVARHIRQNPHLEGVLLVAITGYGQDTDKQKSKEAGFERHLVKPVEPADLKELLAAIQPPKRW